MSSSSSIAAEATSGLPLAFQRTLSGPDAQTSTSGPFAALLDAHSPPPAAASAPPAQQPAPDRPKPESAAPTASSAQQPSATPRAAPAPKKSVAADTNKKPDSGSAGQAIGNRSSASADKAAAGNNTADATESGSSGKTPDSTQSDAAGTANDANVTDAGSLDAIVAAAAAGLIPPSQTGTTQPDTPADSPGTEKNNQDKTVSLPSGDPTKGADQGSPSVNPSLPVVPPAVLAGSPDAAVPVGTASSHGTSRVPDVLAAPSPGQRNVVTAEDNSNVMPPAAPDKHGSDAANSSPSGISNSLPAQSQPPQTGNANVTALTAGALPLQDSGERGGSHSSTAAGGDSAGSAAAAASPAKFAPLRYRTSASVLSPGWHPPLATRR